MDASQLQRDLNEARAESAALRQDLQSARAELERMDTVNANLMAYTAQASAPRGEDPRIPTLEAQLKEVREERDRLEAELMAVSEERLVLKSELELRKADNQNLTRDVDELGRQLQRLSVVTSVGPNYGRPSLDESHHSCVSRDAYNALARRLAELEERQPGGEGMAADATELSELRAYALQLEQTIGTLRARTEGAIDWESRCYQAESKVTDLEVRLADAERDASRAHDLQRQLDSARAELNRRRGSCGLTAEELEQQVDDLQSRLRAAEDHSRRISEQYERLQQIRVRQDERLREFTEMRREHEQLEAQSAAMTVELSRLRAKEQEYSRIIASIDTTSVRQEERLRDIEQKHGLELHRRDEMIAALREERSRLIETAGEQRMSLHIAAEAARRQNLRGSELNIGALQLGTSGMPEPPHSPERRATLRATAQLRSACRTLRNIMD
ncbi:hypothetical protein GMRT_16371 [Giardia muris]|uniref:Uncharacterized protein n=1 Tax=Giardia muris TaxID=5742 RepID=A0A4Z1T2B4_GIAMU|nr:hypothetical protein GMRT_16371 [Giardia muris]|eukprot:TNJ26551.1 hypothetical protein GMRT_16371 [Giardia muris]